MIIIGGYGGKKMKKRKKFKARVYRDSWNIDNAFYKWVLPRLKCFIEYADGYPDTVYKSFDEFIDDIKEKIKWVEFLDIVNSGTHKNIDTKKLVESVWNENLLDTYIPNWKEQLEKAKHDNENRNTEEYKNKLPDCFKQLDIDWVEVTKEYLMTSVLAEAFGEWFGKNYFYLWW